jgi:hypothetical protein
LLEKWRPEKHELLHFIAAFLDRNLWIEQSRASFVECLKAIKVMTYYQMTNYHGSDTC